MVKHVTNQITRIFYFDTFPCIYLENQLRCGIPSLLCPTSTSIHFKMLSQIWLIKYIWITNEINLLSPWSSINKLYVTHLEEFPFWKVGLLLITYLTIISNQKLVSLTVFWFATTCVMHYSCHGPLFCTFLNHNLFMPCTNWVASLIIMLPHIYFLEPISWFIVTYNHV